MDNPGLLIAIGVIVVSSVLALVHKRRDGRLRAIEADFDSGLADGGAGSAPGPLAGFSVNDLTIIQFSATVCSQCAASRRVWSRISEQDDGISFTEINIEDHLDLVRALGIMRTPTSFIIDKSGAIRFRVSGAPREADVVTALAELRGGSAVTPDSPSTPATPATPVTDRK